MKNSPVRVLLIGAAGRMGKTVLELAQNDPEIKSPRNAIWAIQSNRP